MHISLSVYLDIYIYLYTTKYIQQLQQQTTTIVPIFKHKSNLQKSVEKVDIEIWKTDNIMAAEEMLYKCITYIHRKCLQSTYIF